MSTIRSFVHSLIHYITTILEVKMTPLNSTRIYNAARRRPGKTAFSGLRHALNVRRLGQAALALVVCLSMIVSTVGPAFAGELVEGDAPPAAQDEGPPTGDEGGVEDEDQTPPPDEGDVEDEEPSPPPDDDDGKDEGKDNQILSEGGDPIAADPVAAFGQQIGTPDVDAAVSLRTGSATYAYPISVPPGTGGVQPNLALVYNSQSKWGKLGYGWSLSGLGAVSISTKRGAPRYDSSDDYTYVWNGEDLVYSNDDGYYHTRRESYNRIQNIGGFAANSYWVVTDKSGTEYRYGYNSNSRIEAVGTWVHAWALDRVTDIYGNYMTISYDEDTANNTYYPDTITYTSNDAISLNAHGTVKFNWVPRSDVRTSYAEGCLVKIDQILQSIEVKVDGNLLRKYTLGHYFGSEPKSLLKLITQCGADGVTCLPPVEFHYQILNSDFGAAQDWGSGQGSYVQQRLVPYSSLIKDLIDMNGDGRPDDVYRDDNGPYSVRLNNGSGFDGAADWGGGVQGFNLTQSDEFGVIHQLIDVTGDGRPDDVYRSGSGSYKWRKSYGNSFGSSVHYCSGQGTRIQGYVGINNSSTTHTLIDMNGDGFVDDVYRSDCGNYNVALNDTGVYFAFPAVSWGSGQDCYVRQVVYDNVLNEMVTYHDLIDMNGDGLPDDVHRYEDGNYSVRLNMGRRAFASAVSWGSGQGDHIRSSYDDGAPGGNVIRDMMDMNGDGLPDDVFRWDDGNYSVKLNNGSSFTAAVSWGSGQSTFLRSSHSDGHSIHTLIDMDGDGLPDDVYRSGAGNYSVRLNQAGPVNRLTKVTHPGGGSLSYEYAPAATFDNKTTSGKEGLPFPVWVVASVTSDDGMGNEVSKDYSYKGGYYDPYFKDKEFRGFREVTVVDAEGTRQVTTFWQNDAYQGLVDSTESRDSGDSLLNKVENTYGYTSKSGVWGSVELNIRSVYLESTISSLYDGQSTPKQSKVEYTYDEYGNVLRVYNHGDLGVAGDELYGYAEYINDTSSWILGVSKHSYTRASDDTTVVAESWSYYSNSYDGAVDYGVSVKYPRKTERAMVFGSRGNAANPTVEITYDQWGNVVSSKNALGQTLVTTEYDSAYHEFPIASTNALGQTSYTYYYGVNAGGDSGFTGSGLFGQVKSVEDVNGKFARSKYDVLGRVVAVWGEAFSEAYPATSYEYAFWTDAQHPNKIVTHVREQEGQAKTFDTFNYSDGLGRVIQRQNPSEEAGKMMVSGPVDYDSRGLVRNTYIGYEATSDGAFIPNPSKLKPTTFTYDAAGRLVRTDLPDGTFNRVFFNQYETTTVDANGRQSRSTVDVRGQVVKTEAFTGTYPTAEIYATTTSEYDPRGELVKITDNVGNQTTFTRDNLGRKIAMDDPDMGVWSYTYDKLGRMTSQTDAKGQTVTFEYDILGRLVKKTYPDGSYVQYDFDTFGGYTGGNSLGRLVRVSKNGELDDYGEVDVFSDDFSDGDYTGDPAWYTSQGWTVTDGYLKLTSGFVGQDIRSDEISISSTDEVVIEYDTVVYSTFAYYNLIYLRDSAGNVIIGGGILYDRYNNRGGALYIYDGSAGHYLTGQSIATGVWKHVKITFSNGDITVDYDNGAVTFTKPSAYSTLEDIETVQLGGWYHSSGAKYDNIVVTTANNGPSNGPSTVFYYDDLGRQVKTEKTIEGVTYTNETVYDDMGRVGSHTYPEGSKAYYTYNPYHGGVAKIGSTAAGGQYLSSLEHNEYGLLTAKTFGNGVTVNYTYHPDNFRLTNVLAAKGANTVQNIDYFYDNVGMVTGIIDHTNMNWTYEYDDLYRLTRAKHGSGTMLGTYNLYDKSYAYDTTGNITNFEGHSYAYNDADHVHAVTSDGRGNSYTYDANGDMLSGAGRAFTWNYSGKPAAIVKDGTAVEFTYGPEGERVKKAWDSNYKIYVGKSYEKDQAGNEVVYLMAGGARIKKKSDGSLFFFLSDHLGGMNVILDASGNKVSLQHYYPYGGDDPVGSFENEVDAHKFTDQEEDVETGLYYYGARYYDPALGRFVSPDHLLLDSLNRYTYCANNPVNVTDPSGHYTKDDLETDMDELYGIIADLDDAISDAEDMLDDLNAAWDALDAVGMDTWEVESLVGDIEQGIDEMDDQLDDAEDIYEAMEDIYDDADDMEDALEELGYDDPVIQIFNMPDNLDVYNVDEVVIVVTGDGMGDVDFGELVKLAGGIDGAGAIVHTDGSTMIIQGQKSDNSIDIYRGDMRSAGTTAHNWETHMSFMEMMTSGAGLAEIAGDAFKIGWLYDAGYLISRMSAGRGILGEAWEGDFDGLITAGMKNLPLLGPPLGLCKTMYHLTGGEDTWFWTPEQIDNLDYLRSH